MLLMRRISVVFLATGALLWAMPAMAGTLTFSDIVSKQPSELAGDAFTCGTAGHDPCVDAAWLDATVDFTIDNLADTVTIVLTNNTGQGGDPTFDINRLYFSTTASVLTLSSLSVTHSVEGVLINPTWTLNSSTGNGGPTHGDGFGVHDWSLTDGVGNSIALVGPTETLTVVLDFTSTGDLAMLDFMQLSEQTNILTLGALKFVNADPSVFTFGDNDSGFGAVVPEPATAAMVALGLLSLGWMGRRR
jgi:hypothetical protein